MPHQWNGPSPHHPYTPQYFSRADAGSGCQAWNPYRDFGVGQMGDMGAHTLDLVWNVIDASAATGIEADKEVSDKYDPNVNAVKLKVTFEHPKNSWRGPITVVWYQGGLKPVPPKNYFDLKLIPNGAIFEGTKGSIIADFNSRVLIPDDNYGDLTYFNRRPKEQLLPLLGGTGQIITVRRGIAVPDDPPQSDSYPVKLGPGGVPPGYSGTMMEEMLLGIVAHAADKKIQYDLVAGRITNALCVCPVYLFTGTTSPVARESSIRSQPASTRLWAFANSAEDRRYGRRPADS